MLLEPRELPADPQPRHRDLDAVTAALQVVDQELSIARAGQDHHGCVAREVRLEITEQVRGPGPPRCDRRIEVVSRLLPDPVPPRWSGVSEDTS